MAEGDGVYRFYHQSMKVFWLQGLVRHAERLYADLAPPGMELNGWFRDICSDACNHEFEMRRSNPNWLAETRPILEAFWHCSYFARMLAKYGRELDEAPQLLDYGWAAVLSLYGVR